MVATSSDAGKVRVIGSQLYVLLVEQIFYGKQSLGAHASFRPFLYERTHYTSGRTWANICSPSGYGVSSINSDGHKTLVMALCVSDELSFEVRVERRTTTGNSSGLIMGLVPAA